MPYRKIQLVNGEIYHIIIKRISNELLFENIDDYYRGIFSVYEFNNANPVEIRNRRYKIASLKKALRRPDLRKAYGGRVSVNSSGIIIPDERDRLVEVLLFCFMPTHIHLLLRQLKDNGISLYIKKMGGGYARYFKDKHQIEQRGYFFQDRFKAVHIKNDNQLRTVFVYIHINPTSLIEPGWKEKGIKNPEKVIKFLEKEYRWSSLWDYLGKKNFPSVTKRDFILKIMDGEKGCEEAVRNWIRYKSKDIKEFSDISLE